MEMLIHWLAIVSLISSIAALIQIYKRQFEKRVEQYSRILVECADAVGMAELDKREWCQNKLYDKFPGLSATAVIGCIANAMSDRRG